MTILNANRRVKTSSNSAKKDRRLGKIPGILYGKNISNIMFEIAELELSKEISKNGEYGVVDINIENKNHKAVIKNVQRDPVYNNIIHLDLEEVWGEKKIHTEIPIFFQGEDYIIRKGGVVQKEKTNVKVECFTENIPKAITVNLSKLDLGDKYKLSDVEVSKDISFVEDLNTTIASIAYLNKATQSEEE